jgi:16S rRNA (adenine1518-N6/adenine1519-N6)-dimethyltransferase
MTPQELKQLFLDAGLQPVHDRGQNFLMDETVVEKMIAAADVHPGSRVLEIGPGPGILTQALLAAGAEVTAVEIDLRLARLLRERFAGNPNFKLVEHDVLDLSNRSLHDLVGGGEDWQVVANLPYAITSAVIEKFVFEEPRPRCITLMLQREVVDRLLAKPNNMSSIAVMVQALAEPQRVTNVSKGAFWPAPKVDSAVIHICLKNAAEQRDFFREVPVSFFQKVVRAGFAHRRRQLKNNLTALKANSEQVANSLKQAKIKPTARPEELTPENWRDLARYLQKNINS